MEDDTTHPPSSNGIAHPAPEPEAPDVVDPLATALLSGHAARDEKLGLVFHSRPERYDDLTLLRGIGDALHTKLQEHGIYTFRQIALWTEEHIREFDSRLVAKDRIRREQWVKQARNLHFLKYGEQIKTLEGETTP
jgi:NADH-quinone oxidoreductase subunit E